MKSLDDLPQTNYRKYRMQFFATAVASLSGLSLGAVGGYTSPAMPEIQKEYSLNNQEVSIVISIAMFGSIIGCFAGGSLANTFGRKPALMLAATIYVLSWLILLCAQFSWMLYISRFVGGFGTAIASTSAPMYVTEIASAEIRGILGSCYVVFAGIGILFVYTIGAFISWRYLALACMGIPVVQIALLILLPESPIWLMKRNHGKDLALGLKWLNRSYSLLGIEEKTKCSDGLSLKSILEPALIKPFLIMGVQMLVLQFSGIGVIILYAVTIFQSATSAIDPNLSAIIVAAGLVVSHLVAFVLVDKLGRRILLLISSFFMSVGMIALGTYYYAQDSNPSSVANIVWLPVTSLFVFVFSYGVGFGPIPWIMMGELFPNHVRSFASSVITTFHWALALIVAKTFVDLQAAIHDYGVFWLYGAVSVFAIFFTYFFVPETKGMTVSEIEEYFKKGKDLETCPLLSS